MTPKNRYRILFVLLIIISFSSCQDETLITDGPTEQDSILANSTLSSLMSRIAANNGAADNSLDAASCFSVELPASITVNNVTLLIETLEDLEAIEVSSTDANAFEFVYPITVIFNDYTRLIVQNEEHFESVVNSCSEEDFDSLPCADFVYPISFSVFNSAFSLVDTIVIQNDEALYHFLEDLETNNEALIVSLDYPVNLIYHNGETISVTTNEALANAIEASADTCELSDCDEDEVALNLKECQWTVSAYSSFTEFIGIDIVFSNDDTFTFFQNGNALDIESYWSVTTSNNSIILNLDTDFEDFGGEWTLVECEDDRLQFTKDGETMVIEQDCVADLACAISDIPSILQECPWTFSDGTDNFDNLQMVFYEDGSVLIPEGIATSAIGGLWDLTVSDQSVVLNFSELTAFQDRLGGDWLIVACDSDRLELLKGDDTLVLEQDCENPINYFECFESFDAVIELCDEGNDGTEVFDLTFAFSNCTPSADAVSYHETQEDAETGVNAIVTPESYSNTTTPQTVYIRVEIENTLGVYPLQLLVSNCEESCSEADVEAFLVDCIWNPVNYNGSDNLMPWNFDFEGSNNIVVLYTETDTIDATWLVSTSTTGVVVAFSNVSGPNIQAITGEWLVVECNAERIQLHRNDDVLVLERTCS